MLTDSLICSVNREEQEKVFLQWEDIRKLPNYLLWEMSAAFGGYLSI